MATCLTLVPKSVSMPEINRAKNTGSVADIANTLGVKTLSNFTISAGKYVADPVTFAGVPSTDVGGLVVSNCNTGEIIGFQVPAQGVSADTAGDAVVTLNCVPVKTDCCLEDENRFDIDFTADPCTVKDQLFAAYAQAQLGGVTFSIRNADFSETRTKPNPAGIWSLYVRYDAMCSDQNGECASRVMLDIPGRH